MYLSKTNTFKFFSYCMIMFFMIEVNTLLSLQENHLLEWAKNGRKTLKTDAYASVLCPLGIPREKAGSKLKIAWATILDAHCVGLTHAKWTQNA